MNGAYATPNHDDNSIINFPQSDPPNVPAPNLSVGGTAMNTARAQNGRTSSTSILPASTLRVRSIQHHKNRSASLQELPRHKPPKDTPTSTITSVSNSSSPCFSPAHGPDNAYTSSSTLNGKLNNPREICQVDIFEKVDFTTTRTIVRRTARSPVLDCIRSRPSSPLSRPSSLNRTSRHLSPARSGSPLGLNLRSFRSCLSVEDNFEFDVDSLLWKEANAPPDIKVVVAEETTTQKEEMWRQSVHDILYSPKMRGRSCYPVGPCSHLLPPSKAPNDGVGS